MEERVKIQAQGEERGGKKEQKRRNRRKLEAEKEENLEEEKEENLEENEVRQSRALSLSHWGTNEERFIVQIWPNFVETEAESPCRRDEVGRKYIDNIFKL